MSDEAKVCAWVLAAALLALGIWIEYHPGHKYDLFTPQTEESWEEYHRDIQFR